MQSSRSAMLTWYDVLTCSLTLDYASEPAASFVLIVSVFLLDSDLNVNIIVQFLLGGLSLSCAQLLSFSLSLAFASPTFLSLTSKSVVSDERKRAPTRCRSTARDLTRRENRKNSISRRAILANDKRPKQTGFLRRSLVFFALL